MNLSHDGIITFGGQNENGFLDNNLRIMRFYNHYISDVDDLKLRRWEILKVKGEKPCKRINHSMNILNKKAKIVMIGGKDEEKNTTWWSKSIGSSAYEHGRRFLIQDWK